MSKTTTADSKKRTQRPFPSVTLEKALIIAQTIQEKNVGKAMKRLFLADAAGIKPSSSNFKILLSASYKYGLTLGTEKAEYIELTELGKKITKPKSETELAESKQLAVLSVELFKKIFTHWNNGKFPNGTFFENTLEGEFSVPREHLKEAVVLLEKNGRFAGIIRDISGSPHVILGNYQSSNVSEDQSDDVQSDDHAENENDDEGLTNDVPVKPPTDDIKQAKPIFIAHGKNKVPLQQLEKILKKFQVPYKVAVDEPHAGRPISQKVKELMHECGSAIFIFSSDEMSDEPTGLKSINLNVVFELGAASVLYGEKVIIFKEKDLELPSDFSDLGHISFVKNELDAKAMDLLNELISMGFLKLTPA